MAEFHRSFGPQLAFKHVVGYFHDEPVLLLKACIGNRSLGWVLLPPGSERWEFEAKTAQFWDTTLAAVAREHEQVRQMGYYSRIKHKNHANANGAMAEKQQQEYRKDFEAKLISPAEADLWKRGASNASYH